MSLKKPSAKTIARLEDFILESAVCEYGWGWDEEDRYNKRGCFSNNAHFVCEYCQLRAGIERRCKS